MAKTPTETAIEFAKALEMRRANGGEIASFGTTPEKVRELADERFMADHFVFIAVK